eukprot:11182517-Lingulodinium_polyedra.AAC.1
MAATCLRAGKQVIGTVGAMARLLPARLVRRWSRLVASAASIPAKCRSVVSATSDGPCAMVPSALFLMGRAPAPFSLGLPAL